MPTRRSFIGAAGAVTVGAVLGPVGVVSAAPPVADMEAILKAAQIDPRRPDTALTPRARASVLLVERALAARGLLSETLIDGHFGTSTIAAYSKYQKSLGYRGIDASGLPGRSSLQALGRGRYTVGSVVTAGARSTFRGWQINARTMAMLLEAERRYGAAVELTQGGYNPGGDPTSVGTHDGGGALDISVDGINSANRTRLVKTLRLVGFAAWLRTPDQSDWPFHIHAVAISDPDLSSAAQHQVGDYYLGKNGLARGLPDDGPVVATVTWEEQQRG